MHRWQSAETGLLEVWEAWLSRLCQACPQTPLDFRIFAPGPPNFRVFAPDPPRFQSFSFQIRDRFVGFRRRNACSLQVRCPEFGLLCHGLTMSDEGTERSVILFNGFRVTLPPLLELCYLVNNVPFHQNQTSYQCLEISVSFWHFSRPFPFTNNHSSKVKCFKNLLTPLLSHILSRMARWVSPASATNLLALW